MSRRRAPGSRATHSKTLAWLVRNVQLLTPVSYLIPETSCQLLVANLPWGGVPDTSRDLLRGAIAVGAVGPVNLIGSGMLALFLTSLAERDGCAIRALRGDLDIASAQALREELLTLLGPGSRLIIDLSEVEYADASGIAVLVGGQRRAGLLGGWLRLAALTPAVAEILAATGLNRHLAIFPTVEAAISGRVTSTRPDAIPLPSA